MSIFEKVFELRNIWICNSGKIPNRIFLGYDEIHEARADKEYLTHNCINNDNDDEFMFGIKVVGVCIKNHISVGNIIENDGTNINTLV